MKTITLKTCTVFVICLLMITVCNQAEAGSRVGDFTYNNVKIMGNDETFPSHDDPHGAVYLNAFEELVTPNVEQLRSVRFGATVINVINATDATFYGTTLRSPANTFFAAPNYIGPKRSMTGLIRLFDIVQKNTFYYSTYYRWSHDPQTPTPKRNMFFTIKCWNKGDKHFDPEEHLTGLKTATQIVKGIGFITKLIPKVGSIVSVVGTVLDLVKYAIPTPPDPNTVFYRIAAYMTSGNPQYASATPQMHMLMSPENKKDSYDSIYFSWSGTKEKDPASNYVVQVSQIRRREPVPGQWELPMFNIIIYYSHDFNASLVKTYCEFMKNDGTLGSVKQLDQLADFVNHTDTQKLSQRFKKVGNEDSSFVLHLVESAFSADAGPTSVKGDDYEKALDILEMQ